jgi:addiction module HigA family antidote
MARQKEYPVTATPKAAPVHPGELLREDVLPALGMSVSDAARELRVSRQTLHRILSGNMGVSPEMAVRLGKFCGNGPGLWLRMQVAHDLWHIERRMRAEIKRIPTRHAA